MWESRTEERCRRLTTPVLVDALKRPPRIGLLENALRPRVAEFAKYICTETFTCIAVRSGRHVKRLVEDAVQAE